MRVVNEGITAEAPIVLGGHHDARGRFDHGFDGELHGLTLVQGLATDEDLAALGPRMEPRHVRLRFGAVPRGSELLAEIELESRPVLGGHWIETEVEIDEGVRGVLQGAGGQGSGDQSSARQVLFPGDRHRVVVRLDTTRTGRFDADLTVRARRGRSGTIVEGAPVRVHFRAHIVDAGASSGAIGPGLARGLGLGLGIVALVIALFARRAEGLGRRR